MAILSNNVKRQEQPSLRSIYLIAVSLGSLAYLSLFTLERIKSGLITHLKTQIGSGILEVLKKGGDITGLLSQVVVYTAKELTGLEIFLIGLILLAGVLIVFWEFTKRELSDALMNSSSLYFICFFIFLLIWFSHSYLGAGYLVSGDAGSHVARVAHFRMGLEEGKFIFWDNYFYLGSPFLQFYPPMFFWITGLLDYVIKDANLTTKLVLFFSHVAGGLCFWFFLKEIGLRRFPAAIGAIAYSGTFAHIHIILWGGDFPQALIIVLMPLAFLMLEKTCKEKSHFGPWWAGLTLVNGIILISHQATGMHTGIYIALYAIGNLVLARYQWSRLIPLLASAILGIVISLFVIIPVLVETPWVQMPDKPQMIKWVWPTFHYFKTLLIWNNTGSANFDAYLGLSVVALAVTGILQIFRGNKFDEVKSLTIIFFVCLIITIFLRSPAVRHIIFTFFFVSALAGIGVNTIISGQRAATWAPAFIVLLLLLDLGSTAIQPILRTDRVYFDGAGDYLTVTALKERFLLAKTRAETLSIHIGPGGPPLLYHPLAQLIGAHNRTATRSHNYIAVCIKRAEKDLLQYGKLSEDTTKLLSLFNVSRIIHDTGTSLGFYDNINASKTESPLGKIIKIENATPVVFSPRLITIGDKMKYDGLDRPLLWNWNFAPIPPGRRISFHINPNEGRVLISKLDAFIDSILEAMKYDPKRKFSEAIVVRNNKEALASTLKTHYQWTAELLDYDVKIDKTSLNVKSNGTGYMQLSHSWYPSLEVKHNGKFITPIQSAMSLIVLPVENGINHYEITPVRTNLRIYTGWVSFATLLTVCFIGVITWTRSSIFSEDQCLHNKNSLLNQFICFTGVGAVGTAAQYISLIVLVEIAKSNAVVASSIGFVLGAIVNYYLNYRYTFRSQKAHWEALSKFFIVAMAGIMLNTVVMAYLTTVVNLHYLIAQITATGTVLIWNFIGNRMWTFREKSHAARN